MRAASIVPLKSIFNTENAAVEAKGSRVPKSVQQTDFSVKGFDEAKAAHQRKTRVSVRL